MEGRSAPLGAATGPRPEAEVLLTPGTRLLFYTDGLVDRRGRSLERGLALLTEEAGDSAHGDAGAPGRRRARGPARRRPAGRRLPARPRVRRRHALRPRAGRQPEELAPLRDDLRAWLSGNAVVGTIGTRSCSPCRRR